jgi:hypothetical protein
VTAPAFKTRSEQKLEWFNSERSYRRLTDEEWQEVARAEHAVYCRTRRSNALYIHEREERELLAKIEAESTQVNLRRIG